MASVTPTRWEPVQRQGWQLPAGYPWASSQASNVVDAIWASGPGSRTSPAASTPIRPRQVGTSRSDSPRAPCPSHHHRGVVEELRGSDDGDGDRTSQRSLFLRPLAGVVGVAADAVDANDR